MSRVIYRQRTQSVPTINVPIPVERDLPIMYSLRMIVIGRKQS